MLLGLRALSRVRLRLVAVAGSASALLLEIEKREWWVGNFGCPGP